MNFEKITKPENEVSHPETSTSSTFVLRLCIRLGLECSIPPSEEEIFDDTDESGNKLNAGFDCCVWCLELWEARCGGGLGGCGVGFPWASSASRLRRFMTVGRNLDVMARSPASCRYHKIRNHLWYPFGIMVLRFHLGICGKMMHDEYKELKQLFHNVAVFFQY